MRDCRKCGEAKPDTEFWRHPLGRDGLDSWCKTCKRAKSKAWYDKQPKNPRPPRLPVEQQNEIRALYLDGATTQASIAKQYGVSQRYVSKLVSGTLPSFRCPQCGAEFATAVARGGHIVARHVRFPDVEITTKTCSLCRLEKPIDAFAMRNRALATGYGRESRCRDCKRLHYQENKAAWAARDRERRYGLNPEQWERFLKKHRNRCAICGSQERLGIDHDHDSGQTRGLLCSMCNAGIGCLGDSPERLEAAASYLRGHREDDHTWATTTKRRAKT
jgi:hypothetical protein